MQLKVDKDQLATWALIVSATVSICTMFFSVKTDLNTMKNHMANDWTMREQERWAKEFQKQNPTLKVPDPESVLKNENH